MFEVRTSEVLDKMVEKKAFNMNSVKKGVGKAVKGLQGKSAVNQKLIGAGIGAGTGALAGAAGNEDNRGKGALTGGLIGAAGGAAGGALAEKNLAKATNKAFAKGLGTGVGGTVLGGKAADGLKNMAKGTKFEDVAGKAADKAKDISKGIKDKGGEYGRETADGLKDIGERFVNLFKTSSEYRNEFGDVMFEKIASSDCTFREAMVEMANTEMYKIAIEEMPAEEFVEKTAANIIDGFAKRYAGDVGSPFIPSAVKKWAWGKSNTEISKALKGAAAGTAGAAGAGIATKKLLSARKAKALAAAKKDKIKKLVGIGAGSGAVIGIGSAATKAKAKAKNKND